MKRYMLSISIIMLVAFSTTFAQNKIDKFCQVTLALKSKWSSTPLVAKISFGENKWLFSPKDSIIVQKLNYVNSLATEIDVLNYMSKLGWQFIDRDRGHRDLVVVELFFKKTFDVSEFMDDPKLAN